MKFAWRATPEGLAGHNLSTIALLNLETSMYTELFYIFTFIALFILLICRNATEAMYIGKQLNNYRNLLPGDAKILLSDRNFLVCLLVYRDMTEI